MACPLFDEGRLPRCNAVSGLVIPSCHERERYCRSDDSGACPTRKLYSLRGRALPQDDYFALWVAPVPTAVVAERSEPISLAAS